MYRQSKTMLSRNTSSTCPHIIVNVGPQTAEFGAPQQISTGFAYWLRYCTDVAQRRSTKLCTMFGRLLRWYTIYTLSGALAPNGILPGAKFTLCPSLAFSYFGSVTARHSSRSFSTKGATYMPRVTITLGIGTHFNFALKDIFF